VDIKVREKAHEEDEEAQMGQSSVNVLQTQCQDAGTSQRGAQAWQM